MGIIISLFSRCCGWGAPTKETAVIVNKAVDLLRMDSSMYCTKCNKNLTCEETCYDCVKNKIIKTKAI